MAFRRIHLRLCACFAIGILAAGLSGCSESGHAVASEQPTITGRVGDDLAARADEIARLLARGDVCAAEQRSLELERATKQAIQNGSVPAELRGALKAAVRRLADEIDCSRGEQGTKSDTVSTPTTVETSPAGTTTAQTTTTGTTTETGTTTADTTAGVTTPSG